MDPKWLQICSVLWSIVCYHSFTNVGRLNVLSFRSLPYPSLHITSPNVQASSVLERALQRAEERGGWHRQQSFDEEDAKEMLDNEGADDAIAKEVPRDGMAGAISNILLASDNLTPRKTIS